MIISMQRNDLQTLKKNEDALYLLNSKVIHYIAVSDRKYCQIQQGPSLGK